jgi:hypothetical protein
LSDNSARQEGNQAGGNIAGRDSITIEAPARPENALARLFRRLKEEATDDQSLTAYIKELEIFTRHVEKEEIIGLEGKLQAAGRDDQLDMAMAMKEMIFSQLRDNIFSPTFQQIYATLLGKVFEEFETWVKPAIMAGKSRQEIDEIVNLKIIHPIMGEIESCGDYGGVTPQTIRGMIYFLTGNCHIRWQ